MRILTRDDILKADDRPIREMQVPEWDGIVNIRGMSGKERDVFEGKYHDARRKGLETYENFRARLLVHCLIDENGSRIFNDEKDIEALGEKSGKVLDRLFDVALDESGLAPGQVEELEKNSRGARRGASTSGSRKSSA